jgi:hypothetical protein
MVSESVLQNTSNLEMAMTSSSTSPAMNSPWAIGVGETVQGKLHSLEGVIPCCCSWCSPLWVPRRDSQGANQGDSCLAPRQHKEDGGEPYL